jgi:hypothetical protein
MALPAPTNSACTPLEAPSWCALAGGTGTTHKRLHWPLFSTFAAASFLLSEFSPHHDVDKVLNRYISLLRLALEKFRLKNKIEIQLLGDNKVASSQPELHFSFRPCEPLPLTSQGAVALQNLLPSLQTTELAATPVADILEFCIENSRPLMKITPL